MWQQIKRIIDENQNFLLTTHENPDGDGIGSACALTEFLLHLGKNVRFVTDDIIPSKFAFLNFRNNHEVYDKNRDYSQFQVLLVFDAHRKERLGRAANLLNTENLIIACIDHHPMIASEELFAPLNIINPSSCSVGAMLYTLFTEYSIPLNLQAATGIYTSVFCDTARFSNSTTTPQSHQIADACIKLGVDPDQIYSRLYQHLPLAQVKMFANALNRMETHLNNRVLIEQICREDYEASGSEILDIEHLDLEYIHEFNKLIENVDCVILLRELPDNHVRVSMRSMSYLDISQVMRALGGGGHSKAAGLTWKGSIGEVKHKILEILKEQLAIIN